MSFGLTKLMINNECGGVARFGLSELIPKKEFLDQFFLTPTNISGAWHHLCEPHSWFRLRRGVRRA